MHLDDASLHPKAFLLNDFPNLQIPSSASAVKMLHAGTSDEVREKDISGKYMTPYGYVNSAPEGRNGR